jgi:hypothetical protein
VRLEGLGQLKRFLMAEQVVEHLVTTVIQMAKRTLRPEIVLCK